MESSLHCDETICTDAIQSAPKKIEQMHYVTKNADSSTVATATDVLQKGAVFWHTNSLQHDLQKHVLPCTDIVTRKNGVKK